MFWLHLGRPPVRNRRLTILAGAAADSGAGVAVAVAVMSGAQQPEIVRLGGAAAGVWHDVIDLQQVLGAATAPAGAIHVAAAAPVAPPDRALDRRRDGAAGPAAFAAEVLRRRAFGPG